MQCTIHQLLSSSIVQTLRSDLSTEINYNKDMSAQLKALRTAPATPSIPIQPTHLSRSPSGPTVSDGRVGDLEAAILLYEELSKVLVLSCTRVGENQFRYICAVHHANQSGMSQY